MLGVSPPPPGVTPNFENPKNHTHTLIAACIVCQLLSTSAILLRLYTRYAITRIVRIDDYMIALAGVLSWIMSGLFIRLSSYGLGIHIWDVLFTVYNINFHLWGAIAFVFYGFSTMLTKLSILLFFLTFTPNMLLFTRTVYFTMTVVVIYSIVGSLEFTYTCRPVAKLWDSTITYGSCSGSDGCIFNAASNSATDLTILLLPIFVLKNLPLLPIRQKLGVGLLLSVGGFVLAVSAVRLKWVLNLSSIFDATWAYYHLIIWTVLELNISITCACLMHIKPLLRRHFPKILEGNDVIGTNEMAEFRTVPGKFGAEQLNGEGSSC